MVIIGSVGAIPDNTIYLRVLAILPIHTLAEHLCSFMRCAGTAQNYIVDSLYQPTPSNNLISQLILSAWPLSLIAHNNALLCAYMGILWAYIGASSNFLTGLITSLKQMSDLSCHRWFPATSGPPFPPPYLIIWCAMLTVMLQCIHHAYSTSGRQIHSRDGWYDIFAIRLLSWVHITIITIIDLLNKKHQKNIQLD